MFLISACLLSFFFYIVELMGDYLLETRQEDQGEKSAQNRRSGQESKYV